MNSNTNKTFEIDIKDMFLVILKKIGIVVLSGLILSCSIFIYKFTSSLKTANSLNISEKLNGESDIDYSKRVRSVNRAVDIFSSIDKLNEQIEIQREYVADSIIMQIDATNESVSTAQFVLSIDDEISTGIDSALVASYSNYIISGDYLNILANECGTKPEYLKELISVNYSDNSSVVFNSEGSIGYTGILTITVIGPNYNFSEKIMNCIVEEIESKYSDFRVSIVPHAMSFVGRQSTNMVDNHTRDLQYSAVNRFETIQKQIDAYNDSLDKIASSLGVKNKENLYNGLRDLNLGNQTNISMNNAIKGAVIGFAIGVFIVLLVISFNYVFGKKFLTQTSFFDRFPEIRKIGVVKPLKKRSKFSVYIDKKSGDDNDLSDEINNKILAANIKNLTVGMNKVMITGTADSKMIKGIVSKLNLQFDVKDSVFVDPSCLESISSYDGVILFEQRKYSSNRMIAEELELIKNADTELIGAVII